MQYSFILHIYNTHIELLSIWFAHFCVLLLMFCIVIVNA